MLSAQSVRWIDWNDAQAAQEFPAQVEINLSQDKRAAGHLFKHISSNASVDLFLSFFFFSFLHSFYIFLFIF